MGPHSASPGSLAVMTNVTSSCNLNGRRGPVPSGSENVDEAWERKSPAFIVPVLLIQGPLERRCKHVGRVYWNGWVNEPVSSVYIFWALGFLHVSNETSAIVMLLGASSVLWLLEGARIWKEASLVSRSQNPAVSLPLCKLPVNEWAGHLAPWGSTSGSSDHQLLCLGVMHQLAWWIQSTSARL